MPQSFTDAVQKQTHHRAVYDIEVVDVLDTEKCVEVFARVSTKSGQIGFGSDGTVDIERFRIFNPPILVDDPNGNIVVQIPEETLENGLIVPARTRTLREDRKEAILQVIEHNLRVMKNIHSDVKIVKGKRGNTTSTFFSDSGGDGAITSGPNASFATVRAGTTLGADNTAAQGNVYIDTAIYIRRLYFPFDTSPIDAGDTISSATLTLTHPNVNQLDSGLSIGLVQSNQASLTTLATTDWVTNFTRISTDKTIASFGAADTTYDYVFNATGEGIVAQGSGFTKVAALISKDIDNDSAGIGGNYSDFYFSNEAGTTKDPFLTVEHASSATPAQVHSTLLTLGVG